MKNKTAKILAIISVIILILGIVFAITISISIKGQVSLDSSVLIDGTDFTNFLQILGQVGLFVLYISVIGIDKNSNIYIGNF